MFLALAVPARPQDSGPSEYELKAAFLYSFAKFIDWPSKAFASPQSPFVICILGADPFGAAIDDTLRGKSIGDHPVVVQRAKEASEVRHCQIVFVSSQTTRPLSEILASLQGSTALVVGESDRFADSGGAIQLILDQNHIRFAINEAAAENAGLHISSKLLALAKIVRGSDAGKN
jgi:YfiR/HmsC-like